MHGVAGINDNGSGMAALFEIARLIAKSEGCQRKNSIILVAFDAEEMVNMIPIAFLIIIMFLCSYFFCYWDCCLSNIQES